MMVAPDARTLAECSWMIPVLSTEQPDRAMVCSAGGRARSDIGRSSSDRGESKRHKASAGEPQLVRGVSRLACDEPAGSVMRNGSGGRYGLGASGCDRVGSGRAGLEFTEFDFQAWQRQELAVVIHAELACRQQEPEDGDLEIGQRLVVLVAGREQSIFGVEQ